MSYWSPGADGDAHHLNPARLEDLLKQQAQPQVLLLVDSHDKHGVLRIQEPLGELQPAVHHREPLGVTIIVVIVDVVVVVFPITGTRVVWGIDVDRVDLAFVGVEKDLERVEVLGVDHCVKGFVSAAFDTSGGHQPRVDGVAKLGYYNQVFDRPVRLLGSLSPHKVGDSPALGSADAVNAPHSIIDARGFAAARRETSDLVAPADGSVREFYRLGNVALEVEAESAAAGQRVYLALQVGPELRVEPHHLPDQVGQP